MGCVQWNLNLGCGDRTWWDGLSKDVQDRATSLAWSTLNHLSGGLVGGCPVAARPCRKGCADAAAARGVAWPPMLRPFTRGGFWYNAPCGCGTKDCSCTEICEIAMPGLVAAVHSVWEHGVELPHSAYRIDNGRLLVRQDGLCWPECQDMTKDWDHPDAFTVIYTPGIKPGNAGEWAAGVLAYEFAKACNGDKCRLPSSVSSLSRQGVSMEFSQGMFPDGHTGIREVDAYILSINPNHLTQPPRVWSPDVTGPRYTEVTQAIMDTLATGPFGPEFDASDFAVLSP